MLADEVKARVDKQILLVEGKLKDIEGLIKDGKKDLAVYWLFSVYENIVEAIQDIKDNKKDFQQIKNHSLKINLLKIHTNDKYAECLEKLNKAKNIGAYGHYADERYSAPITDNDVQDCYANARNLLEDLKSMRKTADTKGLSHQGSK
ncbi:hypothetical protein COV19_02855 [Candidatus Woesearchaeota archaeon CG10_big_fil_rev_8_21_14_0_10_44_13]|nr:MAG: hypothetical protein COV19_02855 [Candidatus Woesearchaeota archaeon CG10_big_fil_rev_8_21_14_0_10_44_13]